MPYGRSPAGKLGHPSAELAEEYAMLWDASMMMGCVLRGSDGEVGIVSDLLFDDTTWRMRWLVVNTRYWLPRHDVLLPVSVLGRPDPLRRRLVVDLTKQQIEDSPGAERHPPVSQRAASSRRDDPHLRSVEAVVGHRVHLLDGLIGHVEELLVDDADWSIRYVRVDTCKWRPGDRVLLAPRFVRAIDWGGRLIHLDVGRREIADDRARREVIWMRSRSDGGTQSDARQDPSPRDQAQTGLSAGHGE
jgi:hypothetical protein